MWRLLTSVTLGLVVAAFACGQSTAPSAGAVDTGAEEAGVTDAGSDGRDDPPLDLRYRYNTCSYCPFLCSPLPKTCAELAGC